MHLVAELRISNFKDSLKSDIIDIDHDLASWLDDVLEKIKKIEEGRHHEIPTKPKK